MKNIKLECFLLSSGPSWYTIVMIMLSSWYFVFMKTIYLISEQAKCTTYISSSIHTTDKIIPLDNKKALTHIGKLE